MTSIASRGLTLSYQRQVIIDALDMQLPKGKICLLYTSPSPRDLSTSRMPSSA